MEDEDAAYIARMARGSPGAALALSSGATLDADRLARQWIEEPIIDRAQLLSIADGFRGAEGQGRFETLMDRLTATIREHALAADPAHAARWADLWTRLSELPDRTSGLNLDRADVLNSAVADIRKTKAATRC